MSAFHQFDDGAAVLAAVLFVAGVKAFGNLGGTALVARGAMWSGFVLNLVWAVLLVVFVSLWAADGAVAFANAIALAYAISAVYGTVFVGLRRFMTWRLALRVFAATMLLGVFSYGMVALSSMLWRLLLLAAAVLVGLAGALTSVPRVRPTTA